MIERLQFSPFNQYALLLTHTVVRAVEQDALLRRLGGDEADSVNLLRQVQQVDIELKQLLQAWQGNNAEHAPPAPWAPTAEGVHNLH